jgi:ABC-type bacteriocin/lantibiotic exporter with double-glycine peptidase domain
VKINTETEKRVLANLLALSRSIALVLITHRPPKWSKTAGWIDLGAANAIERSPHLAVTHDATREA